MCSDRDLGVSTICPTCISLYLCVCVQRGTGAFLRVVLHVYPSFLRVVLHVYPCISVSVCREGLACFYELSFMYILHFYELSFMYILVPCVCAEGNWHVSTSCPSCIFLYRCVCAEGNWHVSTSCPSCISLYRCVYRDGPARFYELSFMYILVSLCVQRWTGAFLRVVLHVYPCIRVCAERNWHVSTSCPSCISLYPCVGLARFYELSFMYRPILVSLCVCRGGLTRFYELSFIYILVSLCVQRGTGTLLRVVFHVYPFILVLGWRVSTS